MPYCMNCGTELQNEKYCPNCGMPVDGGKPYQTQKQKTVKPGVRALDLITKAVEVLKQKPVRLWALSLLFMLLFSLTALLGWLPIVVLPISFVLSAGMANVFLAGYRGEEVNSDALFVGFKRFIKVASGMGWMALWILIWGMIPIVGPVFAVIKSYSYRFVPYIMIQDPDISATDALRLSMQKTEGYKGRMFMADFLVSLAAWVVMLVLVALASIRYVGPVFGVIGAVVGLLIGLVMPLLSGLINAAGYEEFFVKNEK